ncbi:MAG TPA: hypothetical protein PLP14_04170, partial [Chitinophagaceae bacterium]|nr:hypothetical protein [Chitinophagaceae bacterium]
MKTILFSSMLLLMLSACQEKPSGTQAIVSDQQEAKTPADGDHYPIDATKSWLHFTGTKPVGTHTAEIKFSEGEFILADQKITGGQFKADLTQLKSLDQDTAYSYKLLAHLQSP